MKNKDLSIIIPQYNELSNLKKGLLHEAFEYLKNLKQDYEVIIVDDGSTDESLDYLKKSYSDQPFLRIIKATHGGKPRAIYEGMKKASGDYILFTDMDQSTPLRELDKLLSFIPEYQVVIGSRGKRRQSSGVLRKIASFLFSTFRKSFVLGYIDDTQCGFKLFESSALKEVFPKLSVIQEKPHTGWSVSAFDVELLYMLDRKGFKIKEVKVEWRNEDISDTKQRKFIKESLDMFKQILNIMIKRYNRSYDKSPS